MGIKAITSGNPVVMEKVKVDTEARKLDSLRSAHLNQQHKIKMELSSLPGQIARSKNVYERLQEDIATRDANTADFRMIVGKKEFTLDDARNEAAAALNHVILSRRNDLSLLQRAQYGGFDILSRGKLALRLGDAAEDTTPDLFIRGATTYETNMNIENPLGSMQSIEHTLRSLDRLAEAEHDRIVKLEKTHADYQEQADRPFEHEGKLRELVTKQKAPNASLDLDKNEQQVAEVANPNFETPEGTDLRP